MKNIHKILSFLLLCSTVFLSCEEEETLPSIKGNLVGSWQLAGLRFQISEEDDGLVDSEGAISGQEIGNIIIQFNEEGTYQTNSEDVFFLLRDFGIWEFVNNEQGIEFSKGVYSFFEEGAEYIWTINTISPNELVVTFRLDGFDDDGNGVNDIIDIEYTFVTSTANAAETPANTIADQVISHWSLETIDRKVFIDNEEIVSQEIPGFGADMTFFEDGAYVFDANSNRILSENFSTAGTWDLSFPFDELTFTFRNNEDLIQQRQFSVDNLTTSSLTFFQTTVQEIDGQIWVTETDYNFVTFSEELDQVANPIVDLLKRWSLQARQITVTEDGEITSQEEISGFGADIEFINSNNNFIYQFDPNFDAFLIGKYGEVGGGFNLPFPYNALELTFNSFNNDGSSTQTTQTLEVLSLTTNELLLTESLESGPVQNRTITETVYRFVPFNQTLDEERNPTQDIIAHWSIESIDFTRSRQGVIVDSALISGYGADIDFRPSFNYEFDANSSPFLETLLGEKGRWEFSQTYDELIFNADINGQLITSRAEVQHLSQDSVVLVLLSDVTQGSRVLFNDQQVIKLVPFNETLDQIQNPVSLISQDWSLFGVLYNFRIGSESLGQTTISGFGADISFDDGFNYNFDPNFSEDLEDQFSFGGAWNFSNTYKRIIFSFLNDENQNLSSTFLVRELNENQLRISTTTSFQNANNQDINVDIIYQFIPFSEEQDAIINPVETLSKKWSLQEVDYQFIEDGEIEEDGVVSGFGAEIDFSTDLNYEFNPSFSTSLAALISSGEWSFNLTYDELDLSGYEGIMNVQTLTDDALVLETSLSFLSFDGTEVTENYVFKFIPFNPDLETIPNPAEILAQPWQLASADYVFSSNREILEQSTTQGFGESIFFDPEFGYTFQAGKSARLIELFGNEGTWEFSFSYRFLTLTYEVAGQQFQERLQVKSLNENEFVADLRIEQVDIESRTNSVEEFTFRFVSFDENAEVPIHPLDIISQNWSILSTQYQRTVDGTSSNPVTVSGFGASLRMRGGGEYSVEDRQSGIDTYLGNQGSWSFSYPYAFLTLESNIGTVDFEVENLSENGLTLEANYSFFELDENLKFTLIPFDQSLGDEQTPNQILDGRWSLESIDYKVTQDREVVEEGNVLGYGADVSFSVNDAIYQLDASNNQILENNLGTFGAFDLIFPTFDRLSLSTTFGNQGTSNPLDVLTLEQNQLQLFQREQNADGTTEEFTYNFVPYEVDLDIIQNPARHYFQQWSMVSVIYNTFSGNSVVARDTLKTNGADLQLSSDLVYFFDDADFQDVQSIFGDVGSFSVDISLRNLTFTPNNNNASISQFFVRTLNETRMVFSETFQEGNNTVEAIYTFIPFNSELEGSTGGGDVEDSFGGGDDGGDQFSSERGRQ